jgi:hypothetical protein
MFSGSFSSTSHSTINYDIFLVQYLHHSTAHPPLPIFLHSKKNSFKDLKKVIIQSYVWNCQGKNCTTKYVCSCLPEVHNIHLRWWNWNNGRKIRHISVPSHIATPSHPKMSIQEDVFVSDNNKLGLFLKEYTMVFFDMVPN